MRAEGQLHCQPIVCRADLDSHVRACGHREKEFLRVVLTNLHKLSSAMVHMHTAFGNISPCFLTMFLSKVLHENAA